MQKPINFDNEIIQPQNLDFLSESSEKAIKENFALLFNDEAGIVEGLTMTGQAGLSYFTVNPGTGYEADGERVQVYTGTNFGITWTGKRSVYLNYTTVNYNPDPTENPTQTVVTSTNPINGQQVPTESYIFPSPTLVSGSNIIYLGDVTADASGRYLSSSSGTALFLAGFLNLKTNTFDGSNISSNSLDSNVFTNPLNYDIWLGSGTDIFNTQSGTNNLGSTSSPFAGIYSDKVKTHILEGFSPIEVDGGGFLLKSGSSIESDPLFKVDIDLAGHGVEFGGSIAPLSIVPQTIGGTLNITSLPGAVDILGASASIGSTDGTLSASMNFTPAQASMSADDISLTGRVSLGGNLFPSTDSNLSIGGPSSRFENIYTQNVTASAVITADQVNASGVGSSVVPIGTIYANEIIILGTGTATGTTVTTPDVALYWPLYFRR